VSVAPRPHSSTGQSNWQTAAGHPWIAERDRREIAPGRAKFVLFVNTFPRSPSSTLPSTRCCKPSHTGDPTPSSEPRAAELLAVRSLIADYPLFGLEPWCPSPPLGSSPIVWKNRCPLASLAHHRYKSASPNRDPFSCPACRPDTH